MCTAMQFFHFLSIFQSTEAPGIEGQRKAQRQRNQAVREKCKVTRWTSLGSQEKNSKGIICKKQWILSSPMFRMDKPTLGNLPAFFLNSLFSVSVSHPFTSYTTYFFNLVLALKSRGKAHKSYGSELLPLECQKDGQIFPLAGQSIQGAFPSAAPTSPKALHEGTAFSLHRSLLKESVPGFPGFWKFLPHFVTYKGPALCLLLECF